MAKEDLDFRATKDIDLVLILEAMTADFGKNFWAYVNMLLFKKDTMNPESKLISVAAWALAEGQSGADMREMTMDVKGRFVVCVVKIREKIKDGKTYENYDLLYIVKPPLPKTA